MRRLLVKLFIAFLVVLNVITGTLLVVSMISGADKDKKIAVAADQVDRLGKQVDGKDTEISQLKAALDAATADKPVDPAALLNCYNQSTDGWIVANLPCTNQKIESKVRVKGVGFGLFENNMLVELMDANGKSLDLQHTTVKAPDLGVPGNFDQVLNFTIPASVTETGKIRFYERSAKDGSIQHLVEFAVKFK